MYTYTSNIICNPVTTTQLLHAARKWTVNYSTLPVTCCCCTADVVWQISIHSNIMLGVFALPLMYRTAVIQLYEI